MESPFALQPWFEDALRAAALSAGRRVLMLSAFGAEQAEAVLAALGESGTLTVVEPDRYRAAALSGLDHPGLAVLGYRPDGDENFGVHDCVIAVPPVLDDWPMNHWGSLARHNLRPGGRLVLDLPHTRHCEILTEVMAECGVPQHRAARIGGVDDRGLARLLRAEGLRGIESHMTTHLVPFETTHAAATHAGELLGLDGDAIAGLHLALTRRLGSHDAVELPFHRTRATAMR